MKKHFLILMLMALLPMAGWADISFGTVQLGDYTYGGATLPVPVVKDSEGSILDEGTHYEVTYDKAYTDAACGTASEVALQDMTGKDGENTYYIKITGKGAYNGLTTSGSFTCKKKNVNVNVTTVFQRNFGSTVEPSIASTEWSVTGFAYGEAKTTLGSIDYYYAGKGNKDYPGGVYPITFSGLTSDRYNVVYPTKSFIIVGADLSGETVTIKEGTAFADKTYKGTAYTAADLTGLVLVHGESELIQGKDFDVNLRYNFTPYDAETGGTAGTDGVYEVMSQVGDVAIVKLIDYDDDATLEGNIYQVTGANGTTCKQLMGDGSGDEFTTASGIWVTIEESFIEAKGTAGTKYYYTVNFKGDYSGTQADFGQFKVVQAPLSVDVENIEVTYKSAAYTNDFGGATVTINYYGFAASDIANKETLIAAFTTPSTVAVKTGVDATAANEEGYALEITKGTTNATSNYVIKTALNTGKLIVKKKEVAIFAKSAKKGPGDTDPAFVLNDSPAAVFAGTDYIDPTTVTFERAEGEEVGKDYEITPILTNAKVYNGVDDAKKDVSANYTLTVGTPKNKLSIERGSLTITIKDQYKSYGEDDPDTFTDPEVGKQYIVTGLVSGDEITSITLKKSWSAETVGTYILDAEVTYTGADHYSSFTVVPGTFEIKKAVLTATLPIKTVEASQTIAAALATLTTEGIEIDGFKKGETVADTYTLALKAGLAIDGDDKLTNQTALDGYSITLKDEIFANYTFMNGTTSVKTQSGKLIVGTGDATTVVLEDDLTTNFTNITAANGETRKVTIELNRTQTIGGKERKWAKGIWNCMVLPFKTTPRAISNALGYAIVNVVNPEQTTEGNVKFKLNMYDEIPANTPFFVKTDADIADGTVMTFNGVTIEAPETEYPSVAASSEAIGYKFVGVYKKYTIDGDNKEHLRFRLGNVDSWNKIGKGSSATWDIVPFNAYMDLGATAGAREVIFTFEELDGSFTAIRSVDIDKQAEGAKAADGWYNLNGMKLQGAPVQKGVYIQNGKKVIIK